MRNFVWDVVQVTAKDTGDYRVKGMEGEGDIVVIIPAYVAVASIFPFTGIPSGTAPMTIMGMSINAFMPGVINGMASVNERQALQQPVIFTLPCNSDELHVGEITVQFNGLRKLLTVSDPIGWNNPPGDANHVLITDMPCVIFMKKRYTS